MPKISTKDKLIKKEKRVTVKCGQNISLVVLDVPPNVGVSIDDVGVEIHSTPEVQQLIAAKNLELANGSK